MREALLFCQKKLYKKLSIFQVGKSLSSYFYITVSAKDKTTIPKPYVYLALLEQSYHEYDLITN